MVRCESGFGGRCGGLRHGELLVVGLQFRCRCGAREVSLWPTGRDGQVPKLLANVMVVPCQALIVYIFWNGGGLLTLRRLALMCTVSSDRDVARERRPGPL